jgi:hypothetical protein
MRNRLLACLFAASAGCAATSDEIWEPNTGAGKADGVTFVDGATIPSQLADPAKRYLSSRSKASLDAVTYPSLLDYDSPAVRQIDGAVPGHFDHRIELAELVALEGVLSSTELEGLKPVWTLMIAPEAPAVELDDPYPDMSIAPTLTPPTGTQPGVAQLTVPDLTNHKTLVPIGTLTLIRFDDVHIKEQRSLRTAAHEWTGSIEMTISRSTYLKDYPHVIAIDLDTREETVLNGTNALKVGGNMVIERYAGHGEPVERILVKAPRLPSSETIPLDEYLDYDVVQRTGVAAPRDVSIGVYLDGAFAVTFERDPYGSDGATYVGTNAEGVKAVDTPISSLGGGHYKIASDVALDVYPTGLVVAHHGGEAKRLTFAMSGSAKVLTGSAGTMPFIFNPATNQLTYGTSSKTLTASMRTP